MSNQVDYKKVIKEIGIKQKYLAKQLGISEGMFSLFVNGEKNIDLQRRIKLESILKALGGEV